MVVCPNCGYRQDGGEKCEKCSSLFAYYDEVPERFASYAPTASHRQPAVKSTGSPVGAARPNNPPPTPESTVVPRAAVTTENSPVVPAAPSSAPPLFAAPTVEDAQPSLEATPRTPKTPGFLPPPPNGSHQESSTVSPREPETPELPDASATPEVPPSAAPPLDAVPAPSSPSTPAPSSASAHPAATSASLPEAAPSAPLPSAAKWRAAVITTLPDIAAEQTAPVTFLDRAAKFYRPARWIVLGLLILAVLLILRKGTPPPVTVDPDAAERAAEKIRQSDALSSAGQPHQLQLDRTELNSFLNENLAINGRTEPGTPAPNSGAPGAAIAPPDTNAANPTQHVPAYGYSTPTSPNDDSPDSTNAAAPTLEEVQSAVKDVKVDMVGDLVKAYVVFNFHGKDLSLELDGHLRAENGYLKFDPVSGSLGSLPLPPGALQSAAQRMFESPENREKMKLPDGVSDIQIVDGNVVINYDK